MKQKLLHLALVLSFYSGQAQFFEGFENTTGPNLPLPAFTSPWTLASGEWMVFNNGVGGRWAINNVPNTVYNGANAAYMNRVQAGPGNTAENYLATPLITVPANGKLRFFARQFTQGDQGTVYNVKVASGTNAANQSNPAAYTALLASYNETQLRTDLLGVQNEFNVYTEKVIDFPADMIGTPVYIAFVRKDIQLGTAVGGDRWLLDNVSVFDGSSCQAPLLTSAASGYNIISASWDESGSAQQWHVLALPCGNPAPTAATTGWFTTNSSNNYAITGLSASTCYDVYVRSVCGANVSSWSNTVSATTLSPIVCGGTFTDNNGPLANYSNNSNNVYTICPSISGEMVTVTFTAFSTEATFDALYVYNGPTVTLSEMIPSQNAGGNVPGSMPGGYWGNTIPGPFASTHPSGCLTFVFMSDSQVAYPGWIANVSCAPAPTCPKPIQLLASNPTYNSATLGWTEVGFAPAWQCLVLPQGSPAPTVISSGWLPATTNPFVYPGLSPGTCYTAYVRSNCGGEQSLWSAGYNFCTAFGPPVCGGNFVDQGGVTGNYLNNSDQNVTICPVVTGDTVNVVFSNFSTQPNYDALYVYNGPDTNAPQLASQNGAGNVPGGVAGGYWGTTLPGPFTSTHPSGCLTFRFRSDGSVVTQGWSANIVCGDPLRLFQLVAFLDTNNNGTKDPGENFFTNGSFVYQVNDSGVNTQVLSYYGSYTFSDPNLANSYDFSYSIPSGFTNYSCTATYSNINPQNGTQTLYFPVVVVQNTNVSAAIVSNVPRPGLNYLNRIIYKNLGTTTVSGTLNFVKDPATAIVSVSQAGTVSNANGFSYDYTNLLPGLGHVIDVYLSVPAIPTVNLGDLLTTSADITPMVNDSHPLNNSTSNTRTVVGSYDPNDKSESRGPLIQYNQFTANDYLYYTINFQNEGTADALMVRIQDVLDAKLDETSIRMEGASHPYVLQRTNNNLEWKFDNINLVPKSADEELSKGYVLFSIKPKPGYALGDIIPNTANIYFDANPPIVTNTFTTTFVALGNSDFEASVLVIFPNPANDQITISSQHENIREITITDVLGKTVKTIRNVSATSQQFDVSDLSNGLYLLEIVTETNLKTTKKLIIN